MPALTPPILTAQVKAARLKTRGGRTLAFRCPDGWVGPTELVVEESVVHIKECRSDLEAREALHSWRPEELVLLVRAPDGVLAEDTLARLAKGGLIELNPRDTLLHLTGAQAIDPRLLMHRDVVSLLVQRWRPEVRLTSLANVIDCGRAFAFLLNRQALATEPPDFLGLLLWSLEDGMDSVTHAPPALRIAFFDWLRETNGSTLNLIEEALKDNANRLVSLGLVLGTLFPKNGNPSAEAKDATIRLESYLGNVDVHAAAAQAWHRAANAVLSHVVDAGSKRDLLRDVDAWLDQLKAVDLAEDCEFSPRGFELRLDTLAAALQTARRSDSGKSWDALTSAEQQVRTHCLKDNEGPRLEVIRMALRLTQWLRQPQANDVDQNLGAISSRYLEEGAFVDWARQKLRQGDGRESLNKAYAALLAKSDERREEANGRFAKALHQWTLDGTGDSGIIPIEDVIEEVLAPLAKESKVLLLVMDGMSGAVFAELMTDLDSRGWHSLRSSPCKLPRPVIAALPSITEFSRAALFRGRLDSADKTTELVNFREQPSLYRAVQSKAKPQLFLKPSLADSGGAGLSLEVRDAIIENESRVVAVVINSVDDQLSTLGQYSLDWQVHRIAWLKDLLDAAAIGERTVVLMSDHGHVLSKEGDRSLQIKTAEGDRHRLGTPGPKEGEIAFSGKRLLAATGNPEWVFSWSEKVRYGGKKSGYHGGVADQEVIIPLAILSALSDNIGSFEPYDFQPPSWWLVEKPLPDSRSAAPVLATPPNRKKKIASPEPPTLELWAATGVGETLSAPPVSISKPQAGPPGWLPMLLTSEVLKQQRSFANRTPISDDLLSQCLMLLESKAGVIPIGLLARELGLPQFRVSGFVAQLQRLLNVEGYMVLETDASQTLRLNRELLFKQFDIKA